MQWSFLMTQKDPSKEFHKDMIRHLTKIVLENSSQVTRDIPWTMTSQNLFFFKRGKFIEHQPKNICHQIVSETVWIVN